MSPVPVAETEQSPQASSEASLPSSAKLSTMPAPDDNASTAAVQLTAPIHNLYIKKQSLPDIVLYFGNKSVSLRTAFKLDAASEQVLYSQFSLDDLQKALDLRKNVPPTLWFTIAARNMYTCWVMTPSSENALRPGRTSSSFRGPGASDRKLRLEGEVNDVVILDADDGELLAQEVEEPEIIDVDSVDSKVPVHSPGSRRCHGWSRPASS